jgi:ribonuclease E
VVVPQPPPKDVRKVVLVNATEPGEIRVAILENGELAEILMERKSRGQQAGNVYKGRVVNVEPSLQAAFVDLGVERNGFLHASDCIPPDGGFSDILKRPPREGRRPPHGGPASPPLMAGQAVPAELPPPPPPPPAPVAPHAAEVSQGGLQIPTPVVPQPAGFTPPAGQGQQPQQGGHPGKRRRRRRGGRRRSGRVRPPGPAPMMAPSSGEAQPPQDQPAARATPAEPPATGTPAETPESSAPNAEGEPTLWENHPAAPASGNAATSPGGAREQAGAPAQRNPMDLDAYAVSPEDLLPDTVQDGTPGAAPATAEGASPGGVSEGAAQGPRPGQGPAGGPQGRRREHDRGRGGRERHFERRYSVQEMLREGQEVLVQVAKEGIGQKGPALTTYISLPGRYLVLMPAILRLGVSKRIESDEERRELKSVLAQLNPPKDMGVIVRTAGMGHSKEELQRDLDYLTGLWEGIRRKTQSVKGPALIYQEGDVVTRVFRDVITDDVSEILVDDPAVFERARDFLRETAPGTEQKLKLHTDKEPLFHKHGVEQQMQRLFNRKVTLRNGGSIVIEQTEALVAIDVNTGRYREKRNQDDTILQTNLEAAREIARQLRLRDIGGLVMLDFIDMDIPEHRRMVERELRGHLARDKARINVLPISTLGVVEMTRQRVRHSLRRTLFDRCPHCSGAGHIKSPESLGLEMLREIKAQLRDANVRRVKVLLNSTAAFAILNQFRKDLVRMEEAHGVTIEVAGDPSVAVSQMQVSTARESGDWVLRKVSEVDDYVRNS